MAVTPAGAQVSSAVATNWKKVWKKNLKPLADKRYYTKAQSNARYQPKGSYEPAGSGYTKAETYTKAEIDAKVAPLVNSVAATAGGEQEVTLGAPSILRSVSIMPPANGTVIVSSSAYLDNLGTAGSSRCSITTGAVLDTDFLQLVDTAVNEFTDIGGTRGFPVTKGVLLTVNLVCDQFSGTAEIQDTALTAIFAPS